MIIMSHLSVSDGYELVDGTAIQNYVGGVYIQVYFRNGTSNETVYEYHIPERCDKVIKDEEIIATYGNDLKYWVCPPTDMILEG